MASSVEAKSVFVAGGVHHSLIAQRCVSHFVTNTDVITQFGRSEQFTTGNPPADTLFFLWWPSYPVKFIKWLADVCTLIALSNKDFGLHIEYQDDGISRANIVVHVTVLDQASNFQNPR